MSHPLRARGLKLEKIFNAVPCDFKSHPLRVRGLKPEMWCGVGINRCVAPPAGAWIETRFFCGPRKISKSHPLRVRGLKPIGPVNAAITPPVAPPAGAWIETESKLNRPLTLKVAPPSGTHPKFRDELIKEADHNKTWVRTNKLC